MHFLGFSSFEYNLSTSIINVFKMYKDSVENLTQSHLLEGIYVEEDTRASGRKRGTLHLMEDAFQSFANLFR